MADYVRHPTKDGGEWVDLTRLTDGRVMCCLCFSYFKKEDLYLDPDGVRWDVCVTCHEMDTQHEPRS